MMELKTKKKVTKKEFEEKVNNVYEMRKERMTHPDGKFDNGGRWYPAVGEKCDCCRSIREPSRAYPYSLMVHCRTKVHIKNMLKKTYEIEEA